jgi:hypothetical protein
MNPLFDPIILLILELPPYLSTKHLIPLNLG